MSSLAVQEPHSGVQPATDHGGGPTAITLVEATATPYTSLRTGVLVAERYRVERFIDAGGMAQIFEATNTELDERVALKLAHPVYRSNPELVARFRAEARALARIRSEHVGRVFDVVSTEAGDPVMVMELLEGENLARLIAKRGLPAIEEVIGWAIETCGGLSVAHANGIVHRDVKPENIFIANVLGGRRTVKLLDFGISRLALTGSGSSERRGRDPNAELKILGTPLYMAPEQILSSKAADPRIDIWSLGVVLFEMLAGKPPFTGKNAEELCGHILDGEIPDLHTLCPDLDPDLAAVVQRCLHREPDERFASVADLAVALLPWGPPRMAVSVEHTVHVLRAAGLTTVDVPAMISVRPSGEQAISTSRSPGLRASVAPTSSAPRSSSPPRRAEEGETEGAGRGSAALAVPSPTPHSSSRNIWIAAVAVVALLAVGLFASGVFKKSEPPVAVAPSPVQMRFETDPSGAMLEIDGAAAGMTPAGAVLLPGRHVVTLTKPGFERLSTVVDVAAQPATDPARFPLTPLPGTAREAAPEPPRAALNTNDDRPASGKDPVVRPRTAGQPPPAATPAAPPPPGPKATVKVIDDKPSTTRVIQ